MNNNSQARKWMVTINNPLDAGLDHNVIISILEMFSLDYWCMADEIATTGTPHTHIYMYSKSPIRFATIKNRFPTAHIDKAYGTSRENRDYIRKEGKWAKTEKAETSVENTFQEWGNVPTEASEESPRMNTLIEEVKAGKSNLEIIERYPEYAFRIKEMNLLRQEFNEEKAQVFRKIEVSYLFGASGTGKTKSIYEKHDAKDICRIVNYRPGRGVSFDAYGNQPVLVFEEFASQIPIEEMLIYLDIYPIMLPARYSDRAAQFTTVYITSNLPLEMQYVREQVHKPETWKALVRRIHNVYEYLPAGTIVTHKKGGKLL